MFDFDPDDDTTTCDHGSAIDLPWFVVGVCAAIVMAICGAAECAIRAARRMTDRWRAAAGTRLIDAGVRIAPLPPRREARPDVGAALTRLDAAGWLALVAHFRLPGDWIAAAGTIAQYVGRPDLAPDGWREREGDVILRPPWGPSRVAGGLT